MPQRTIADARYALEATPGLSDAERRAHQQEIATAEAEARRSADLLTQETVNEVAQGRDDALAELCEVRDAYTALTQRAALGRITAKECDAQLNALRQRQRQAERHLARTEAALTFVERVEQDPVAYGDELFNKFPRIRPEFSF